MIEQVIATEITEVNSPTFVLESHVVECSMESFTQRDYRNYFLCI